MSCVPRRQISRTPFSTHATDVLVGVSCRRSGLDGCRRGLRRRELLGIAQRAFLRFVLFASSLRVLLRLPIRDVLLGRRLLLGGLGRLLLKRRFDRRDGVLGRRRRGLRERTCIGCFRRAQVDGREQRTRVGQRDRAALRQLTGHRLDTAADHAREAAYGALGDRQVGESVDVQVEHAPGLAFGAIVQRADQGEGGQVHALRREPRASHCRQELFDHVALGGHEHDALALAGRRINQAEWVEVEHRIGERHRHLVLGLEAHGRGELLAVGHRRQVERAHHRALIGDAHAHALAETAGREHLAQCLRQRVDVDDLALAHRVGVERLGGGAFGEDRAVHARLHRSYETGLDVKPHDLARAGARRELRQPQRCAGKRRK